MSHAIHLGPAPRKRRHWLKWLIVLLLIPLGLLGFRVFRESQAKSRLQAQIAEADADDPHWRLADLRAEYDRRPVNEHLVEAVKAFPRNPVYLGWHGDDIVARPGAKYFDMGDVPNGRMPEDYLKLIRGRLQDGGAERLRQPLRALADHPGGRLPDAYKTTDGRIGEELRMVMNFHSDEILLALHDERFEDVIRSIRDKLQLGDIVEGCPSLMTERVRMAVLSGTYNHVQALLAQGQQSPEDLKQLQELLVVHDRFDPLSLARLTRADLHDRLNQLHTDEKAREEFWKMYFPALPSKDANFVQRQWASCERIVEYHFFTQSITQTHAEVLETLNSLVTQARHTREVRWNDESRSQKGKVVRSQLAVATRMSGAQATVVVHLRSSYIAVACERYRQATGQWPLSLQALVPEYLTRVPLDPYTGVQLRYRVLPDGACVYSFWRNQIDDGGDVLHQGTSPKDRGTRLYNPDKRGLKYEDVYKRDQP